MSVWIFFSSLFTVVVGNENYEWYGMIVNKLDQKLSSDYDRNIIPYDNLYGRGPTVCIKVNVSVKNLGEIDDLNMEYSAEVAVQQTWKDPRLQFENAQTQIPYVKLNSVSKIWQPDTFFANEKQGHFHNTITPYLKIFSDGTIAYITTLRLKLSCPMNLKLFPMDQHICYMRLASYAYTTDHLVYLWEDNDAIQIVQGLLEPTVFELKGVNADYCNTKTYTGEFSCLMVKFWVKRNFLPYLVQIFMPCSFMIFISWLPFWLKKDSSLERILIGVALLLFMLVFIQITEKSLPASSYLKAIDIWMYGSLGFILIAFIVVVLTNQSSAKPEVAFDDMVHTDNQQPVTENEVNRKKPSATSTVFRNTDLIFRVVFPAAFAVFIYIYYYYVYKVDHE